MSKSPKAKAKKSLTKLKAAAKVKETAPSAESLDGEQVEGLETVLQKVPKDLIGTGLKILILISCVALLGIGGFFSWPYWSSTIAPYMLSYQWKTKAQPPAHGPFQKKISGISSEPLDEERRQLNKSLERLMGRIKAIEVSLVNVKKLAQATTPPSEKLIYTPELKNFTGRLETLEKNNVTIRTILNRMKKIREDEVKNKTIKVGPQDKVLVNSTNEDSYQDGTTSNNAAALVLAVENLRQAIATNNPFIRSLEALRRIASGDLHINTAVALLTKNAPTGIPTLTDLKQRFKKIAGKIVQASRITDKPAWQARIRKQLSSLAMWRRIDGKGPDASIDTIVASAELELRADNLKAAVLIVEGLSINNDAEYVAKLWLTDANKRIAADRIISSLHIHAISQLASLKPEKGGLK